MKNNTNGNIGVGMMNPDPIKFNIRKPDNELFPEIVKELSKYEKNNLILKFNSAFPCTNKKFIIQTQVLKHVILKQRSAGFTTSLGNRFIMYDNVYFSSEEDFWKRWNRFKNLTSFL